MKIEKDRVVVIDYTLTDEEGDVIDSSEGKDPLTYLHGHGNIIPGLESALDGRTANESFSVTIDPVNAYGNRDEKKLFAVKPDQLEGLDRVEPGVSFHAQTQNGVEILTIVRVEPDQVIIDGNHPLAGVSLNFQINVLDVREATEEEIAHGHIHGPGCNH